MQIRAKKQMRLIHFWGYDLTRIHFVRYRSRIIKESSRGPTEVKMSTETSFIDLDDYVLRETFQNLDDVDLNTIANVCTWFKQNAQAVFSSRYQHKLFVLYRRYPHFLRNFGPMITSLRFYAIGDSELLPEAMEEVVRYCGRTLTELKFSYVTFTAQLITILEPLLRRLRILELHKCRYDTRIFSLCAELHSLSLCDIERFPNRIHMPKLESLIISRCNGIQNASIKIFLEVNPQLKELRFEWCRDTTPEIIQSIAQFAPQIETLIYAFPISDFDLIEHYYNLKKLTRLKRLQILWPNKSVSPIISEIAAANVPLEFFQLTSIMDKDKQLFSAISELNQLKTLMISGGKILSVPDLMTMFGCLSELTYLHIDADGFPVSDSQYLEIIRRAPKLQHLVLGSNRGVILDVNLYKRILELIAIRCGQYRLEIEFKREFVKVPRELLQANRDLLKINIVANHVRHPFLILKP